MQTANRLLSAFIVRRSNFKTFPGAACETNRKKLDESNSGLLHHWLHRYPANLADGIHHEVDRRDIESVYRPPHDVGGVASIHRLQVFPDLKSDTRLRHWHLPAIAVDLDSGSAVGIRRTKISRIDRAENSLSIAHGTSDL